MAVLAPVASEHFDDYVLVGKLGHGGMAEVFLALSHGPSGFRKLLVLKRLHGHLKDDPTLVGMFLDEARLAARLSHPHVVQTNKVGSFRGHHFLAMEFLDGQALNRILKHATETGAPLPVTLGARVLSDALDGLHYAHEAMDFDGTPLGIVHRDVSPHNLFVTYEGQVKVLDFGIAKATTQESNTRTGTIKGKFAYIAPEQARGEQVDARADVWSMGVTMWEVLAGRRLFRRGSEVAVLQATLSEPIPFLTEVVPTIPRELAEICDRALQRDPTGRYPNALAMKHDIDEWIAAASKTSSRMTLGAYMKETFAPERQAQRAAIRECVGQIEGATGRHSTISALQSLETGSFGALTSQEVHLGTPSGAVRSPLVVAPAVEPGTSTASREAQQRNVAMGVAVLALLVLVGVVAFVVGSAGQPPVVVTMPLPAGPAPEFPLPVRVEDPSPTVATADIEPVPSSTPVISAMSDADELVEEPTRSGGRRRRAARDAELPEPAAVPTPEPPPADPMPPAPAPAVPGRLHLDCTPYAVVTFEGRRLGVTPIDVELPAGTHTLTLRNPEAGLQTTYRVTVRSGETTTRTVALE